MIPDSNLVAHMTMLHLPYTSLVPNPDNPRGTYLPAEVAALAESIQSIGGVEQPLIICPDGAPGRYQVIDGHMRLAAAQSLGCKAPLLKCEVREGLSRKDRLLIMARTSSLFFAKDPISEAKHFRRLIDEEGTTRTELARAIGRSLALIDGRLELLRLDGEIQALVASRRLPKDARIVAAFLSIEDRDARVRLAGELGRRGATVKGIAAACRRVVQALAAQREEGRVKECRGRGMAPALAMGLGAPSGPAPAAPPWPAIRSAAAAACGSCEVRLQSVPSAPEPAWSLISHATEDTCDACGLSTVRQACNGCPLPELLGRLLRNVQRTEELQNARAA